MRRRLGFILVVLGLVATVIGVASGCGSLFSFNGRHPVALHALTPGTPVRATFPAKEGKRYTLAVHVVFEREGLPEHDGALVVEAKLPLVAAFEDSTGAAVSKTVGWLDPSEPPTVLYGHDANPHVRRPEGVAPAELVAERLIGPYTSPADRDLTYVVDLGVDRLAQARVKETRIVIYDDALPASVTFAFVAAAVGLVTLLSGTILLLFGLLRARRGGARGRQIV